MTTVAPEREVGVIADVPKKLYIDGQWRDAEGGATLDVVDPSTGEVMTQVADASPEDGWAALQAADRAQADFAAMAPRERADILMRAFDLMHQRVDDLALVMTLEMGKPLAESYGEVKYAAEFFRHFAEEATRISGNYQTAPAGNSRFLVSRQPVGPSLLVTPRNFPLAMGTRKIGPAIAAGCTSVIKPASSTPLSMLGLAQVLEDAGAPKGVVNVITTSTSGRVMEPMIRSGVARKLFLHRFHRGRAEAAGAVRGQDHAHLHGEQYVTERSKLQGARACGPCRRCTPGGRLPWDRWSSCFLPLLHAQMP